MYYAFFGLSQAPFRITPDTDFFFEGGNRGAILEALIYAISQGEGIIKVTGEVGSGKTMLCRVLQTRLPKNIETVYLANPSVSPDEILDAIAFELQLPIERTVSRVELMRTLNDHLLTRYAQGRQVVVFVEEAQSMPIASLEEMRLLSNLETKRNKLLQIVLFGQPELDENLSRPEIRQLRERITHSFSLQPLNATEVGDYLGFRLNAAGYRGPDLFGARVVRHLTQATAGLIRRINIVADKALLAAFADNTHNLSLRHVKAAITESEFARKAHPAPKRKWAGWALSFTLGAALIAAAYWFYQVQQPIAHQAGAGVATLPAQAVIPRSTRSSSSAALAQPPPVGDNSIPEQGVPITEPVAQMAAVVPHQMPSKNNEPGPVSSAPARVPIEVERTTVGATLGDSWLETRLRFTSRWLQDADGQTFSIQLLGADDPTLLRGYLESIGKYIDVDKLFVYRTVAKQQPSITVLYGTFVSRDDAGRVLEGLPSELKANGPYIRTVQGIRAELDQHRAS